MRYTEIDTTKYNSYRLKSGSVSESLKIINGAYNKLGQLEDIEQELEKLTFYGKVLQYPNQLIPLHFLKIYHGKEFPTDIRIEFEIEGLGNVFYHVWDYGKTWALTKEELEK